MVEISAELVVETRTELVDDPYKVTDGEQQYNAIIGFQCDDYGYMVDSYRSKDNRDWVKKLEKEEAKVNAKARESLDDASVAEDSSDEASTADEATELASEDESP